MADTSIEWADKSWNPVTGCSTDVRCHDDRLKQPISWKKPKRKPGDTRPDSLLIFVNSMSDLFHEDVPFEFIDDVFAVMAKCPQHTHLTLTKRPGRMLEYFNTSGALWGRVIDPWPLPNVWLGVSVEDQKTADERIPLLLQMPAAVRWVSYEPALGPVQLDLAPARFNERSIDWLVCGGESGHGARPMQLSWARSARDQCVSAGIPFFFKQWGEWLPAGRDADTWDGLPIPASYEPVRVGKKAAGRLLDMREWNKFPKTVQG